ncbi:MAG: hypothetical protein ABI818_10085 [Acidobacteriota bacterium]
MKAGDGIRTCQIAGVVRPGVTLWPEQVGATALDKTEQAILATLSDGIGRVTSEVAKVIGLMPRATRTRMIRLVERVCTQLVEAHGPSFSSLRHSSTHRALLAGAPVLDSGCVTFEPGIDPLRFQPDGPSSTDPRVPQLAARTGGVDRVPAYARVLGPSAPFNQIFIVHLS